jgi:hypothetical protein
LSLNSDWVFLISKDGVEAGNGDIDTPEPAPHILKLDFTAFKLRNP